MRSKVVLEQMKQRLEHMTTRTEGRQALALWCPTDQELAQLARHLDIGVVGCDRQLIMRRVIRWMMIEDDEGII